MNTQEKARIRWACRRGMLEVDRLLLPFFDEAFDTLSESDQALFVALLNEGDNDLFSWLMGASQPDNKQLQEICEKIRVFHSQFTPEAF